MYSMVNTPILVLITFNSCYKANKQVLFACCTSNTIPDTFIFCPLILMTMTNGIFQIRNETQKLVT